MDHSQSYMPVFESFGTGIEEYADSAAEDIDEAPSLAASTSRAASSKRAANDSGDKRKQARGKGKRKIEIEYVKDKKSRAVTFSKRKAGIFTKARELSTLTGSSVLLLVVSESGVVYTYTTEKFQPMVTQDVGKNMIAACLSGKVNLDDRFSTYSSATSHADLKSSHAPKRGGEIILKDVFAPASPLSAADTASINQRQYTGTALPPLPVSHSPSLPEENSPKPPVDFESNLVKVPRLQSKRRRLPGSSLLVAENTSIDRNMYDDNNHNIDDVEQSEDELTEGECESQMRKLRRSLSIERRFEKLEEEERPRLLRNESSDTPTAVADQDDSYMERTAMSNAEARRREGWSFTAAEDAWDSFKDRFSTQGLNQSLTSNNQLPPPNQRYHATIPLQRIDCSPANREYSNQHAQVQNGNARRPAGQMMFLPELPPP